MFVEVEDTCEAIIKLRLSCVVFIFFHEIYYILSSSQWSLFYRRSPLSEMCSFSLTRFRCIFLVFVVHLVLWVLTCDKLFECCWSCSNNIRHLLYLSLSFAFYCSINSNCDKHKNTTRFFFACTATNRQPSRLVKWWPFNRLQWIEHDKYKKWNRDAGRLIARKLSSQ